MQKLLTILLILIAAQANAATRYIDGTLSGTCSGNYSIASRNCSGSDGNGYKTFAAAAAAWATGDTIYVRAGTYDESIDVTALTGGTVSTPTWIGRYQSEVVTMRPTTYALMGTYLTDNVHYLTIYGLVFDGVNNGDGVSAIDIESNGSGPSHITIDSNEIKNFQYHGIYIDASNNTFKNNIIHDQVTTCAVGTRWYGAYEHGGNNNLWDNNLFYNNPGGAMQVYPNGSSGIEIRNNIFHNNNTCSTSFNDAVLIASSTSPKIHHNIFYSNGKTGGGLSSAIGIYNGTTGALVYNNTIYDHTDAGVQTYSAASGTIIRNNIILNSNGIVDAGTGTTNDHNITSGTAASIFVNPGTDFSLLAGASTVIDQGTASIATGITACANGSAPDIGAIETLGTPTAIVNAGTATITVPNNCTNQMLPASSVTGWSFKKSGVADVVTANSRSGANSFSATLTSAFGGADTCLFSYSQTGNTTADNNIGNLTTSNQEVLAFTDSSCTNATAGGGGSVGLSHWRAYLIQGATDTAWIAIQGCAADFTNCVVPPGAKVWIRAKLLNNSGSDYPAFNYKPKWRRNGGTYYALSDGFTYGVACTNDSNPTCAVDIAGIRMLGIKETQLGTVVSNASATTADQLTSDATNVACVAVLSTSSIPSLTLANSTETECAHAIQISTSATPGDTYEMCPYTDTDTALTCSTPIKFTVGSYASVR